MVRRFQFKQTCGAIPEQYDIVALDGTIVGYIRLQFGMLTATIYSTGGREFDIYCHTFKTDISEFVDDKQREKYLTKIALKLKAIMHT